jgi:hypothetical protein
MSAPVAATSPGPPVVPPPPGAPAAPVVPTAHRSTFRELLADLNPLQHIPLVGTLYRAITGDNIPELAREGGSFLVSGLIGGPIGLLTNLAMLGFEKITGIDPEKIGQKLLAGLGIGSPAPGASPAVPALPSPSPALPSPNPGALASAAAAAPVQALQPPNPAPAIHSAAPAPLPAVQLPAAPPADPVRLAWSAAELAAYGVSSTAKGELQQGDLQGADVLNGLELARHDARSAAARYAAAGG